MTGINTFISNFKDGARPNRFRVIITWPALVGSPNVEDFIVCSAAAGPGVDNGITNAPFMGRDIPFPGDKTFEPWVATFVNAITYSHRNAFERWSNLMNSNEANVSATADPAQLRGIITVQQLGRDNAVLKTWALQNAFPSNVALIDLNYETKNTMETFQVTFAYTHWDSLDAPTS